jgi:N-succinyldiaminopimelate aminotransferase
VSLGFNPNFSNLPTTIFEVMSGLARAHDAINLGQGFPDSQGPEALRRLACDGLMTGSNQYPPMLGIPALRAAVADHYAAHQGLVLSPEHVVVTSGATEALAASFLALLSPGDEVIVLDPAYDAYRPLIARAGGIARTITLKPPHWNLELADIEGAVTNRTRAIVLNNPMNPTGRSFGRAELMGLAKICQDHDLLAICDEVWEHVRLTDQPHMSLYGVPGMAERTVKIGSAGKMFGVTGWKVGFVCAQPEIAKVIGKAHQFLTFTTPPHLQAAIAQGLGWDKAWFHGQAEGYQSAYHILRRGLMEHGFHVLDSEATYFMCLDLHQSGIDRPALEFCLEAVKTHGVAAIPLQSLYEEASEAPPIIRLCFAKQEAVLRDAIGRLAQARQAMSA